MIARLKGKVEALFDHSVIMDTGGVGYLVSCSTKTLQRLGEVDEPASLWIETVVRAESLQLFGFLSLDEQNWFRLLLTVQGVGTRMALSLLSAFELGDLADAILSQDKSLLTRAEGVGPKLAARLVTELKEKVEKMSTGSSFAAETSSNAAIPAWTEALSALCNLGYGRFEAQKSLENARKAVGEQASLDQLIRLSLNELSRRRVAS